MRKGGELLVALLKGNNKKKVNINMMKSIYMFMNDGQNNGSETWNFSLEFQLLHKRFLLQRISCANGEVVGKNAPI
jgi:hypothetical protein